MHLRFQHLVFAVLLGSSLVAQTHVSSPRGVLGIEGEKFTEKFGAYSDARFMLFDGEMRNHAMSVKQISYRDDYAAYTDTFGMGRTWSNVTIDMAACDMANLSPIFNQNATTVPTRVFSGAVTWSTNSGHPLSFPAQFSKVLPFSTTWAYDGLSDICIDHDFTGGTMANNASWAAGESHNYRLDAFPTNTFTKSQEFFHGNAGVNQGCADGGGVQGAMNFLHCNAYNAKYHNPALRDKYELYTFSYFTAQNQPVANIVNFVGSPKGLTFPSVTCNLLYLDVTKYLMVGVSNANGQGAWSGYVYPSKTANGLIDYNPAFVNIPLWAQAFWNDSQTGAIRLSRAVSTKIPSVPRPTNRSVVFQNKPHLKSSFGFGPYEDHTYNPIIRYTN